MWLFAGPFFLWLGVGMALGLLWVVIRFGPPLAIMTCQLIVEFFRQLFGGFWAGLCGKEPPEPRL